MKTALVVAAAAVAVVTVAAVFGGRAARRCSRGARGRGAVDSCGVDVAAAELHRRGRARRHIYAAGGMVGETGRFLGLPALRPGAHRLGDASAAPGRDPGRRGPRSTGDLRLRRPDSRRRLGASWPTTSTRASGKTAHLPRPLFNEAAVAMDGKIYVLGGFSGGKGCEASPCTTADSWSESTPCRSRTTRSGRSLSRAGSGPSAAGAAKRPSATSGSSTPPRRSGPGRDAEAHGADGTAVAGSEIHTVWEHTYQIYDAEPAPEPGAGAARTATVSKRSSLRTRCTPWAVAPPTCTTPRSSRRGISQSANFPPRRCV